MTTLSALSKDDAAAKAAEVILRGMYEFNKLPDRYRPYEGTFEQWLEDEHGHWFYDDENKFLNRHVWEQIKHEGREGKHEGFTANRVAEYGGEGQGDDYWVVVSVSDGLTSRYFRMDGWYASYGNGGELDGEVSEVTPVEKMVVFYE